MHECTEREMIETDRVWKTHGSQTLAVRLDAVTGSMLIPASTGAECEVGYEL